MKKKKEYYKKIVDTYIKNPEGWKYVLISLIGNLFPVWFLFIIEFSENGINCESYLNVVTQPYTYIILSVTFATTTLYLWMKKIKADNDDFGKRKTPILMILYAIVLFPVIGYFLSKKEHLEAYVSSCLLKAGEENAINSFTIRTINIIICVVILLYIHFQLSDFAEIAKDKAKSNANMSVTSQQEIDKMNNEL